MTSLISDSSVGDWLSDNSPATQSTQTSVESDIGLSTSDPMQPSLGSTWASYLSAQYQSREVAIFRRAVSENFKQIDVSVASLHRDLAGHQALVTAASTEFSERSEQIASELRDMQPLRNSLPTLQLQVTKLREQTSKTISDLSQRLMLAQQRLEGVHDISSRDIRAVQEQYFSALEKIEFLQGELREMREERMSLEEKITTLERRLNAASQERQQLLSEETMQFLGQMQSRRNDLMSLLDRPSLEEKAVERSSDITTELQEREPEAPEQHRDQALYRGGGSLRIYRKRKADGPLRTQAKRTAKSPPPKNAGQNAESQDRDFERVYDEFRNKTHANGARSEGTIIRKFIESIAKPEISRHVQESLTSLLPDHVRKVKGTRQTSGHRCVHISNTLTREEFRAALRLVPSLHGREK
ncbi:hypothetical protein B0H66DRAFT_50417 [Apodospora peruviana]|uniref:Uncharacterized protein n=1 Tax=Apodospora peruviana TaxID=516989 RepID=A0AAE0ISL0_9PEZI|nr:hypothetical protein B0H66DRAFT_50417 [Apodospora peruviana]